MQLDVESSAEPVQVNYQHQTFPPIIQTIIMSSSSPNPSAFRLAHLSGTWARVAHDFLRLFYSRYPTAKLIQLTDTTGPTYGADMEAAYSIMRRMGESIKQAFPDCLYCVIACNTMHLHKKRFERDTGLRMLDMVEAVMEKVRRDWAVDAGEQKLEGERKKTRVGVVGTLQTMADLYEFGKDEMLVKVVPPMDVQKAINRIIVKEAFRPAPCLHAELLQLLEDFARSAELDCLILGCTDLPNLLQDRLEDNGMVENRRFIDCMKRVDPMYDSVEKVPMYDSVEILVEECGKFL